MQPNSQFDLAQANTKHLAADDELEITYDPNMLEQYINDLNHRLEPLDLKLNSTIDEVVGEKLWAMVRNAMAIFMYLFPRLNALQDQYETG